MSKELHVRIPDENVVKLIDDHVTEKHGKKSYKKGKEVQKIIKIGLMVCGCPELQEDKESNDLLNTYINSGKYAHTNEINMIKAIDTTPMNRASNTLKLTTKKDRAYYVLNHLKSIYKEEFTFKNYLDKSKELLERANDNRTIASNIELLEKDGAVAWVYDRYNYHEVLDEEGDIDYNKRKLTSKQRFKFTYNTQLIKENQYYLKDKAILRFTDSIKRYIKNEHVNSIGNEITDSDIKEFAEVNGFESNYVWIGSNILMYQGFLKLMKTGAHGINIYAVNH